MLPQHLKALTVGLAAFLVTPASAYIRFSCSNYLVQERADPIVKPGAVSGHVHKIAGGNGSGFTMDYAQARGSQCSSCPIKQDLSNYWTPKLYYQAQNGSFIGVPTAGDNSGLADTLGGMTVYYQQRGGPNNDKLQAFPEGFRMLAGDPFKRNFTGELDAKAVSFACLGQSKGETNEIPNYNCPGGLRAQVYFPSCWDGVNLDSPDHKSHMHYPIGGSYDSGTCPPSHPVHLISLFYEVLYDTNRFRDQWYGNSHPFVFAQGDPTGYGFHGDFLNGWDVKTLQDVVDQCTDNSVFGSIDKQFCPPIDKFSDAEQNACRLPTQVDEPVTGLLESLPGCNPVQEGPERAVQHTDCGAPVTLAAAATYYTDLTRSKGWEYVGCGSDDGTSRTLGDKSTQYMSDVGKNMSVEWCTNFCEGYTYAGMEDGSQCWCGNNLPTERAPQPGVLGNCNMACSGAAEEYCGGSWALSIYKKCDAGASCQNAQYTAAAAKEKGKVNTSRHLHHRRHAAHVVHAGSK